MTLHSRIDSDAPQRSEDRFGRLAFAQQLADYLILQPGQDSLVLGLEGEWGSGKSWVIEQVKQRLAQQDVVTISFNPWLIGSETELIGAFMQELSSQLTEHGSWRTQVQGQVKKLAQAVASYGDKLLYLKYLKYLPGVSGVGEFVEDHAEQLKQGLNSAKNALGGQPSLGAARRAIEQAIDGLQQPIVVIIDDLDRLRKTEIQTMIQLVKAVGNFKGMSYLLSYDSKYVAQAISHDGHIASGYAYLEKIVQLACHLPPLVPWIYRDWLGRSTRNFLQQQGISLSEFEEKQFDNNIKLVSSVLRHLRDAVRWQNRLRWVMRSCAGEIDFGDLMVVEAVQIVSPESIRALVAQTSLLFPNFDRGLPRENRLKEFEPDQWLAHVADNFAIQRALLHLFPHLFHSALAVEPDAWERTHHRLQVVDNWVRYLNLSSIPGQRDAAHISALLQNSAEYGRLAQRFDGWGEFADFCHLLLPHLQQIQPHRQTPPSPDLSTFDGVYFLPHFCRSAKACWDDNVNQETAAIAMACLQRLLELIPADSTQNALGHVIELAPHSISGRILCQLMSGTALSVRALGQLQTAWFDKLQEDSKLNYLEHDSVWDILHSLRQLDSLAAARKFCAQAIESKKLHVLFKNYTGVEVNAADLVIFDYLPPEELLFPGLIALERGGYAYGQFISTFSSPAMIAEIAPRHPAIAAWLRQQLAIGQLLPVRDEQNASATEQA